jgi:hypothetical protein
MDALMVEAAAVISHYVTPDGTVVKGILTLPIFFLEPLAALRLSYVYQW